MRSLLFETDMLSMLMSMSMSMLHSLVGDNDDGHMNIHYER